LEATGSHYPRNCVRPPNTECVTEPRGTKIAGRAIDFLSIASGTGDRSHRRRCFSHISRRANLARSAPALEVE